MAICQHKACFHLVHFFFGRQNRRKYSWTIATMCHVASKWINLSTFPLEYLMKFMLWTNRGCMERSSLTRRCYLRIIIFGSQILLIILLVIRICMHFSIIGKCGGTKLRKTQQKYLANWSFTATSLSLILFN